MGCSTINTKENLECIVKNGGSAFVPEVIMDKLSEAVMRIELDNKICTAFLMKICLQKKEHNFILTCAHSISKEIIERKITIQIFYGKSYEEIEKKIKLDSNERFIKCFQDHEIDVTIIEVLPEDNIPEDNYLYPDLNYENGYDQYIGNKIYTAGYPNTDIYKGDKQFSSGNIKKYKDYKNKVNFCHNCSAEEGSSGSPLINYNQKVLGIHYGCNSRKTINHGFFVGEIIKILLSEGNKIIFKDKTINKIEINEVDNELKSKEENLNINYKENKGTNDNEKINNEEIDKFNNKNEKIKNKEIIKIKKDDLEKANDNKNEENKNEIIDNMDDNYKINNEKKFDEDPKKHENQKISSEKENEMKVKKTSKILNDEEDKIIIGKKDEINNNRDQPKINIGNNDNKEHNNFLNNILLNNKNYNQKRHDINKNQSKKNFLKNMIRNPTFYKFFRKFAQVEEPNKLTEYDKEFNDILNNPELVEKIILNGSDDYFEDNLDNNGNDIFIPSQNNNNFINSNIMNFNNNKNFNNIKKKEINEYNYDPKKYDEQFIKLKNMGFTNENSIKSALVMFKGNMDEVIEFLLNNDIDKSNNV